MSRSRPHCEEGAPAMEAEATMPAATMQPPSTIPAATLLPSVPASSPVMPEVTSSTIETPLSTPRNMR